MRCARQILKPSPSHQQCVPPATKRPSQQRAEKEHSTEGNSANADFFIKTPSTFLPARRVVGPQQWSALSEERPFLKENAASQLAIAHRPNYKPRKKSRPYKSFGATLQAFVLYKKRATNVNLCSLDDGIPVHEKINVAALSPLHLSDAFDALEEYFCAFPQASLFVLTLQPLQKYSEKIIWTSFSPTHRTVTQPSPLKRRLCPSIVVS